MKNYLTAALLAIVAVSLLAGCKSVAEQENQKREREKLERPLPPPRI